jgi:hypothetical protein
MKLTFISCVLLVCLSEISQIMSESSQPTVINALTSLSPSPIKFSLPNLSTQAVNNIETTTVPFIVSQKTTVPVK